MSKKPKLVLLYLPSVKPRNPLIAAAKLRKAGSHRPPNKTLRAQSKRAFKMELAKFLKGESYSIVAPLRGLNTVHLLPQTIRYRHEHEHRIKLKRGLDAQQHRALY